MSDGDGSGMQRTPGSRSEKPKRETAQATLSAIGDVGVAASEMFAEGGEAPRTRAWPSLIAFVLLLYVSSVAVALGTFKSAPLVRLLVTPCFLILCAATAFWSSQVWKLRARNLKFRLKIWQDALDSLGHEVANAANAVQMNLTGFRMANPQVQMPEHLDEIKAGVNRIKTVVQKSTDPLAWKGPKQGKKDDEASSGKLAQHTRSRIAL
jgi:hypothetical protein